MFTGFQNETFDFLWGIRLNNNKAWFEADKEQYLQTLYQPMKELAKDIFEPFRDIPGLACKVSRIYRDARYSHATLYKESLWISIRRESNSWSEHPCLFFELTPDTYSYGFVLLAPKADAIKRLRQRLEERPEEFLKLKHNLEQTTGLQIAGEEYCRKKPCQNAQIAPYYNLKQIRAFHTMALDEKVYQPELAELVKTTLQACLPLNEYCQQFAY